MYPATKIRVEGVYLDKQAFNASRKIITAQKAAGQSLSLKWWVIQCVKLPVQSHGNPAFAARLPYGWLSCVRSVFDAVQNRPHYMAVRF